MVLTEMPRSHHSRFSSFPNAVLVYWMQRRIFASSELSLETVLPKYITSSLLSSTYIFGSMYGAADAKVNNTFVFLMLIVKPNASHTAEHYITEIKIQKGIFEGDSLLPLLCFIATMRLNNILRKFQAGCNFTSTDERMNNLMYMDSLKLFAKTKK